MTILEIEAFQLQLCQSDLREMCWLPSLRLLFYFLANYLIRFIPIVSHKSMVLYETGVQIVIWSVCLRMGRFVRSIVVSLLISMETFLVCVCVPKLSLLYLWWEGVLDKFHKYQWKGSGHEENKKHRWTKTLAYFAIVYETRTTWQLHVVRNKF